MNASTESMVLDALRTGTADVVLDRPVDDILRRGARLRRRRMSRIATAVTAASVIGAAGISLATRSPEPPPVRPAVKAWGADLVNLPPWELKEAGGRCREALRGIGISVPANARPVAADARGRVAIIIWRVDHDLAKCTLSREQGEWQVGGWGGHDWQELPPDKHYSMITLSAGSTEPQDPGSGPGFTGPLQKVSGVGQVSDAVDAVLIVVDGRTFEATVGKGLALFWMPDGISQEDLDDATVWTYDADGRVLDHYGVLD
ncbi:hypothetical protein [Nocardioides speluncae]|uniref:hypothetical protein n=1 Tax=Nocardioides speluncae TaxID=2670337 RepID=UPI000D68EF96|nr:hypothetical protein [Nocardioides speluncae]